jgi:hypothetical protein
MSAMTDPTQLIGYGVQEANKITVFSGVQLTRRNFLPLKQLCHVHCALSEGELYLQNLSGRG